MLTGRVRLVAAAAILIPAVIYLGMDTERHPVRLKQAPNPAYQQSDYYIVNGRIRDFAPTGELKHQLSSTQLEHQPAQQQILVTNPEMRIYNGQQPTRKVSSLRGMISDNDDKIELEGEVLFQDSLDPVAANTLKTESLTLLPQENIAKTDEPVTISGPSGTTSSIGMTIDTDSGILNLLSDVNGVYNVN
ncbi:LPS export ABC transporter periplasmic protein LptC [Amphritea opalescens]|uniref:LPS export ABC transporter periplasmic protein LptC n=1 Tax=Amphritea opalescens TaxID=2490544 RepID=A0A430KQX8_9GAMM|nr:LPS export ABC transporter periplasmic protein LptC [Amphritea opalescens]RTE65921.1 LPS export ABC transporter periplasmic protein LptC [Amphritea opalescens]